MKRERERRRVGWVARTLTNHTPREKERYGRRQQHCVVL